jgi:hypothetical protein
LSLAYLTADEVNADLARRSAEACGATLQLFEPRDAVPDGRSATMYDLDYLPQEFASAIMDRLLGGRPACPTAVHCYNLDEAKRKALRAQGVLVSRRLSAGLVRALLRRARRDPVGSHRSFRPKASGKRRPARG